MITSYLKPTTRKQDQNYCKVIISTWKINLRKIFFHCCHFWFSSFYFWDLMLWNKSDLKKMAVMNLCQFLHSISIKQKELIKFFGKVSKYYSLLVTLLSHKSGLFTSQKQEMHTNRLQAILSKGNCSLS